MKDVFICESNKVGFVKVAKVSKSNQRFTYVNEIDCAKDERYLAAMWLSVAPEKRYATKEFTTTFRDLLYLEEEKL